jgi:diguanylate cyclase (GGDEF)-like protein
MFPETAIDTEMKYAWAVRKRAEEQGVQDFSDMLINGAPAAGKLPAVGGIYQPGNEGPLDQAAMVERSNQLLARFRQEHPDAPVTPLLKAINDQLGLQIEIKGKSYAPDAGEEVLARAFTDPLSGLPNRRSFTNSLAQAVDRILRSPSQLAVLVVDIDGFRELTDAFGPAAGDRLLLEVTRRLQLALRGGDVLARSGFDVFLVLAEHVGTDGDAFLLGERLRRCMAQPWMEKGQPVEITVSCGVATSGRRALSGPELLDAAEGAMQQVKRDGGDGVEQQFPPLPCRVRRDFVCHFRLVDIRGAWPSRKFQGIGHRDLVSLLFRRFDDCGWCGANLGQTRALSGWGRARLS